MAVLGVLSVTMEVPDLAAGIRFYTDAGLQHRKSENAAHFQCAKQGRNSIVLLGGYPRKRLHHIALRAEHLERIAERVPVAGGTIIAAPAGHTADGLWVEDPHGMVIHLSETPADPELKARDAPFRINEPGRLVRVRQSAMLPKRSYSAASPLRLGHLLVFTPNVLSSVSFMVDALGMGLADRAQDMIAFTCAQKGSDHHVVAFAKSSGVGFHHASFQVSGPDEVGRGGRELAEKSQRGDWGFGRHTIGSNFFHYIQDPWGSWFEYYSDMDYIDDHAQWNPTNYDMEDSLASWGPAVPHDFVHNYEVDPEAFGIRVPA